MTTFTTTFAAVAEDQYRRERAARGIRAVGGAHHVRVSTWLGRRRRGPRPAGR